MAGYGFPLGVEGSFPPARSPIVLVRSTFHFHRLSPLLYAHCPFLHFDRLQLFYTTFSPCSPLSVQ